MDSDSVSGDSYVTTLISNPGPDAIEVDVCHPLFPRHNHLHFFQVELEYELLYHPPTDDQGQTNTSNTNSDQDSTFGNSGTSLHTSIKSFVTDYPYEHGRRYHAFKAGSYLVPNDEREQQRMALVHLIWQTILSDQLCSTAVLRGLGLATGCSSRARESHRVLDLGTGTGSWAMDWADKYGDVGAVVVGNDLSPIQPLVSTSNNLHQCNFIILSS